MRFLAFILGAIFFIGCKQEKTSVSNFEFYPNTPDSANLKAKFIEQRAAEAKLYNLAALTSGTNDSLVIRFWPWEAFEPWSNMFEFRLDSNGWRGFHYCSYTFPNQDGRIIHLYGNEKLGDSVFVVKEIVPKCGWHNFYDSLNYFQLRSLPTQTLIKNFEHKLIMDGDAAEFEIVTKNSYKWIGYNNPSSYNYQECKTIVKLIEMLTRQLGDDYYWPRNLK